MVFHIGNKVPKGFTALPGSIYIGEGMWILPCKKNNKKLAEWCGVKPGRAVRRGKRKVRK